MFSRLLGAFAALFVLSAPPAVAQTASFTTAVAQIAVGRVTLSTRLYAPAGRSHYPVVVLVSGSGSESEIGSDYTRGIAQAFADRGIGALAYDKRGTGASTGAFTGSDFAALGADAAGIIRYAQRLPQAERVGVWGVSQAGWIIPYALRRSQRVAFAILASPPGVTPFEQVAYFLHGQELGWGLNVEETADADAMHRAVALYYSGRESYQAAQAEVDSHRDARWFHRVVTHPYWDEMTPEGRILDPTQLRTALHERPGAFEIYSARSSFTNYAPIYRELRRLPTFIIYGGADQLVPIARSQPIMEAALHNAPHAHDFRVFDGASHDIQTPDEHFLPAYLEAISSWAETQFAATRASAR